ncbi:hypothetical protein GII33_01635 [Gordonia pseudamarae]|uniref:DUF222 domain-containing protein n=1 Tax=Gordonia pseudamarae TaxID=2831662 RepID=A0ABX6IEQ8_9ACTN|nr:MULTISPECIES: hypothetical protein [Gordonia]MBD0021999.1 hypothetical protein [Gordonia sp. (in: high G+C Gram-positive bacteria)]QHN24861.1 hypothetical protein GII33_01635 [Gordonia pseudamarae]QHN33793.1 hypothetical protein GII31_01630 [Gordonia pseudamarae]
MRPFDSNDYRKRVLAAVDRRGGTSTSDSFELYDIPLEDAELITDDQAVGRIEAVWAFWQKQRDHPKYRTLVAELVKSHDTRSKPLRYTTSRIAEARSVAAQRGQRDAGRYELLDNAIERLTERYGGIPQSKRAGLFDIGAMGGLAPDEIEARLRRHRTVDDETPAAPRPAAPAPISEQRLNQIARLLGEFDQIRSGGEPTPTLLALLRLTLDDATDADEIAERVGMVAERAREMPAGPLRAVLDELVVHCRAILLGDITRIIGYCKAVSETVADYLRPRVRAAVLVEDVLRHGDYEFLFEEAIDRGLGPAGARTMLHNLAGEFGAAVESVPGSITRPAAAPAPRQQPAPVPRSTPTPQPAPVSQVSPAPPVSGRIDTTRRSPRRQRTAHSPVPEAAPVAPILTRNTAPTPAPAGPPTAAGLPAVAVFGAGGGVLTFAWPPGVTEAMVYLRRDTPPTAPGDPAATALKITNSRYHIDGGFVVPDNARPCHAAVASCRRAANGTLEVADAFGRRARIEVR